MVLKSAAAVCGAEIDAAVDWLTEGRPMQRQLLNTMFAAILPCEVVYYSVCIVKRIKCRFYCGIKLNCLRK